jgi:hypothetical protein
VLAHAREPCAQVRVHGEGGGDDDDLQKHSDPLCR